MERKFIIIIMIIIINNFINVLLYLALLRIGDTIKHTDTAAYICPKKVLDKISCKGQKYDLQ